MYRRFGAVDAAETSPLYKRVAVALSESDKACAVLYPAIAEAARRAGADAVGLVDVECSAGLNLSVDRVGITYSNGQSLGDPSSPVQQSASIVGERPVPKRAIPEVVARLGIDSDSVGATDAIARVLAHALSVVTTTWALSSFPLETRLRFLQPSRRSGHRPAGGVGVGGGCRSRTGYTDTRRPPRPPGTASSVSRCSTTRLCAP